MSSDDGEVGTTGLMISDTLCRVDALGSGSALKGGGGDSRSGMLPVDAPSLLPVFLASFLLLVFSSRRGTPFRVGARCADTCTP